MLTCPKCDYKHGWSIDDGDITGDKGEFYTLPIQMKRTNPYSYFREIQEKDVLGCPNCGTIFLDV